MFARDTTRGNAAEATQLLRVSIDDLDEGWTDTQYEDKPFTGIAVETAVDGTLVAETEYYNGFQVGWERLWYYNGQMKSERYISHSGLDGPAREWYLNGRPKSEALYEMNIALWKKEWDEQGNITLDQHLSEADSDYARLQEWRRLHTQVQAAQTVPSVTESSA